MLRRPCRQRLRLKSALLWPVLLIALPLLAETPPSAVPEPPDRGARLEDFVPAGWRLLEKAEGDLDRDKRADAVLVLHRSDEVAYPAPEVEIPRLLVILLATADGYRRAAYSAKAVLCKSCGGVFGDPFAGLKIERGTFVIAHYGGSRDRWGYSHRFRLQQGDWFLIGRTTENHDTLTPRREEVDENLLTGDVIETSRSEKGVEKRKKYRKQPAPLIRLSEFRIRS